jgi:hypothetical protein
MTTAGTGVLGELLRSLEGLRNRKAITLLMVGFILGVILLGIGTRVGLDSFALGFAFGLIGLLCVLFGISAAGIVLMDATRGRAETSYGDAMLLGVLTFLKLLLGGDRTPAGLVLRAPRRCRASLSVQDSGNRPAVVCHLASCDAVDYGVGLPGCGGVLFAPRACALGRQHARLCFRTGVRG